MLRISAMVLLLMLPSCTTRGPALLHADDFDDGGLAQWHVELEKGGTVEGRGGGALEIDVPGGCTVWFKPILKAPVIIEYDVTVVDRGGRNDRVSDLNCFWMARDARSPDDLFATKRSGRFADYNQLRGYYVGLGGNDNTTTRFRRYIGHPEVRPLLPEHDLRDARDLLRPNQTQRIRLIARGSKVQYFRDGRKLFDFDDAEPYTSGWFGFRTVSSHLLIRGFRVRQLGPDGLAVD